MYGIRFVGTNKWVVSYPGGRYTLSDSAGSTWSTPQVISSKFYSGVIAEEICKVEGINSHMTASKLFDRHPTKYLECVRVEFKEIP